MDEITIDGQFGGSRIMVSGPDDDGDLMVVVEDRDERADIYLSMENAASLIGALAARLAEAAGRAAHVSAGVSQAVREQQNAAVEKVLQATRDAAVSEAYL